MRLSPFSLIQIAASWSHFSAKAMVHQHVVHMEIVQVLFSTCLGRPTKWKDNLSNYSHKAKSSSASAFSFKESDCVFNTSVFYYGHTQYLGFCLAGHYEQCRTQLTVCDRIQICKSSKSYDILQCILFCLPLCPLNTNKILILWW